MDFVTVNAIISVAIWAAFIACVGIGRALGKRRLAAHPDSSNTGLGVMDGVVYALLGLVLAFTFNGAAERTFARRAQVGNEVNVIGTAYLRIDVLPPAVQPEVREMFRRYLGLRRQAIQALPDVARVRSLLNEAAAVQTQIWQRAVASTTNGVSSPTTMLLLPALNAMIDEQTTAQVTMMQHPPAEIELVLVGLILLAGLLAGESTAEAKRTSRVHIVVIGFLLAAMFFLIRDLERPMIGLIRLEDAKVLVEDLEKMMAK